MKNFIKLLTILALLLTLGVVNAWGGTKRIYCEYSGVSSWWSTIYVYAWGGDQEFKKYTMEATGTSNLVRCDIDDYHTNLLFYKATGQGEDWETQSVDVTIGSNNRWSLGDGGWGNKGTISNAQRWVPGVCIDGLVDVHNPHTQAFSFDGNDGTYEVSLSEHSTYQFCILDGSTRYTLDNNVWTSNISNYTLGTSGYDLRLTTAGAGTYTFTYNKNTHVMSVTYPTVNHPSMDYCYMINYDTWTHKYLNIWNSESGIAGTTYPGTDMYNYYTKDDVKYYYFAPGDYTKCEPNDNAEGKKTDQMTPTLGKYISHEDSWGWHEFVFTITLTNYDADTYPSNPSVEFNGAAPSSITPPTKTGYTFAGYWTGTGGTGLQVIDKDGNWNEDVEGYTDGDTWIHEGGTATLYAKWDAITISTPTVTANTEYIGEDITINLSTTTTYVDESVVIFYVTDGSTSTTYEVVATPGTPGSAPTYSTTHTATFVAKHPATYSVTAKVFRGKLIDNFDGALAHWKALGSDDNYGSFVADASNPAIQATNGSSTVMQITCGNEEWKTVQTKKAANDETTTNWNLDYDYIYMSMYSTTARTPKIKYTDDDGGREVTLESLSLSANTWQRKQFSKAADASQIDFILPFMPAQGTMYIDDIILSNESSMTAQATSSSASTTITQPTIGSCIATAASTHWAGANINISLSAQTTYLADAVVVFFVTDGSNSTTYEVTATPGTPGANNAITHTATFVAQHPATYSVTAKLYNGKLIDNFDGSMAHWKALGDGSFDASEANPERETTNGSSKVMKITRGTTDAWKTAQTCTTADGNPATNWNYDYGYIYMSMYSTSARTPKLKYSDDSPGYEVALDANSLSADTWQRKQFATTHDIDYILPFMPADGTMYIDDIILSNRSSWAPIQNTSGVALTASALDVAISDEYTVTLNNNSATTAGASSVAVTYDAAVGNIASNLPAKTGYVFDGYYDNEECTGSWIISKTGYFVWGNSYVDASGNWIGTSDVTLYAKWVVRYALYGSVEGSDVAGYGMPGWAEATDFTYDAVNSKYTLDLSLTKPNTTYKFRIVDHTDNESWGLASKAVVPEKTATKLNSTAADAQLATAGTGTYSLTVTEVDAPTTHPQVYIVNPASYQVNYGKSLSVGGTITVVDDASNAIPSGGYVREGGSVTYTAAANTGYTFVGWYTDDTYETRFSTDASWTDSDIKATSNSYAKFVPATLTFTGSTDWDWFDASNWSPACVPTIDHDVILQANTRLYGVEVKGKGNHAKAKSIKIDKSTDARKNIRFEIWSYCSLIVAEDIQAKHVGDADYGAVNAEDLRIETSHFQNGGLICGGASSNTSATYEFHSKSYKSGKWYINQYVGIPFTSMKANQLYDFNIFIYADTVDDWRSPASDTMEPWVGYDLIRQHSGDVSDHDLNGTLILPGKGVGKTKTLSCTRRNPSDPKWDEETNPFPASIDEKSGHQDHMFANSWTAPIEIAAMETSDFTHLVHTIYIFNAGYEDGSSREIGDEAGQWSTFPLESVKAGLIANAVIPAMQAFLVTDTASGSSITLDYKKHVYDPAVAADSIRTFPTRAPRRVKKSSSLNSLTMLVRSEEDVIADRLYIIEGNNLRTDTFDNGWDGNKIMGESFAPQLYAMSDGSKMAVNAVKDMEGMKIGFKAGTSAQNYTFSFDYEEQAEPLYLYDKETNAYTEITNEATYEFTTSDRKAHERFLLTRSNAPQIATGVEEIDTENVQRAQKFMQDQQIFIRRGDKVYSIDGALVK